MKDTHKNILKELIYDTSQKLNITTEDGIMKRFNVTDTENTRIYVKKNSVTYIK